MQVVEIDYGFRQREWSRSRREEIPSVNQSATHLVSDGWGFQNPPFNQELGWLEEGDEDFVVFDWARSHA